MIFIRKSYKRCYHKGTSESSCLGDALQLLFLILFNRILIIYLVYNIVLCRFTLS